ncbi:MAG: DUF3300 domain-containing protein [Phycisphaerae bacterium]|nr:DUF3300 domain-containing protein [Phycisphaerae bacterium]
MNSFRQVLIVVFCSGITCAATTCPGQSESHAAQPAIQGGSLQNHIETITASLKRSKAALHSYQWVETTTVFIRGERKSQTVKNCYYGADGGLQKITISAPTPEAHSSGLRGRIKEQKKAELEDYMKRAVELVKAYVPPDPGIIKSVKNDGAVSVQIIDPGRRVNIVIPGYHKPGDALTIELDIAADRLMSLSVRSYLDESMKPGKSPDNPITMTTTDGTFSDGTLYTKRVQVDAPSKEIQVVVENTGYTQISPLPSTPAAATPVHSAVSSTPTYAAPAPMGAAPIAPMTSTQPKPDWSYTSSGPGPYTAEQLDKMLSPIALYPDPLIMQIVQCAGSPFQVKQVSDWFKQNPNLKGTAAQDAASKQGFDASFVAIVLFPSVLQMMADRPDWTRDVGLAFNENKDAVFASLQRLRKQAQAMGNLQTNQQQQVQTVTTQSGAQTIVVQPANPQVVYVPQYNPTVVYTQPAPPPSTTTSTSGNTAAAGLIGFTAGVIIGAAAADDNHHYYYSCGGWGYHGSALCSEGWNDYYQHRENMANDYYQHRENMYSQYGQNASNRQNTSQQNQENRQETTSQNQTGRQSSRSETQASATSNVDSRQSSRQSATGEMQSSAQGNQASRQAAAGSNDWSSTASSRSYSQGERSGGGDSGALSGYQRGSTERTSSTRGHSSLGSRSGSGSRSGGGGRR